MTHRMPGATSATTASAISAGSPTLPSAVCWLSPARSMGGEGFDHHQERPDILRLSMWAQLERPSALSEPSDLYSAKVEGVRLASPSALSPVDLLVFIYAIAQAWQLSPTGLTGLEGAHDDPRRIAAHRRAVIAAVESMLRNA